MGYTRKFESFKKNKTTKVDEKTQPKVEKEINEAASEAGNMFKVVVSVDVPTSLVNSYTKKVKDTYEKDLANTYGRETIAEELAKYVLTNYLNVDAVHAGALTGDPDPAQAQAQAQPQQQAQVQPQGQMQPQAQGQPQAQVQEPQTQVQEPEAQPIDPELQAQAQSQVQPSPEEFEEIQAQDDEDEEMDEELPI